MGKLILLAALVCVPAAIAGQPVTQPLNPPPPAWQTCKAVGSGTICEGTNVESSGLYDFGVTCGSGAGAFDIFDDFTDEFSIRKWFDADGNLVRRVFHDHLVDSQFSNPLNGAVVPYTQTNTTTDVFAVPGDLGSATTTTTWEIVYHVAGGGAPVFRNTGRTVVGPDGAVLFRAGHLGFFDYFVDGDASVMLPLCAALGGA